MSKSKNFKNFIINEMNDDNNIYPLFLSPRIAHAVGLNKAIILQHFHFWIMKNKSKNSNFREGRTWTYGSYSSWIKSFPFWSKNTIVKAITELKEQGILISNSTFNKKKYDKTQWYTIDYDVLEKILIENSKDFSIKVDIDANSKFYINKLSCINTSNDSEPNSNLDNLYTEDEEIYEFMKYYSNNIYPMYKSKKHPPINQAQEDKIYNELFEFTLEFNVVDIALLEEMAHNFFTSNIETDHKLYHFATYGILERRYYEVRNKKKY